MGSMAIVAICTIVLLFLTLGMGLWIGLSLVTTGAVLMEVFRSIPTAKLLSQQIFNVVSTPELVALPLFILMGEILFHTRLAENLFSGLRVWINRLPGQLLHVNVLACTVFAAVSGSSAATTATVGRITLDELDKRGYDGNVSVGSLAGAGTLGFLIPPSLIMIVYGVIAEESVLKLFAAGILPGLMIAGLFMLYIAGVSLVRPKVTPKSDEKFTLSQKLKGVREFGPVTSLIVFVLGSMYGGFATPTEGAAFGVLGAIIIGVCQRTLTISNFGKAILSATRTSSMVFLILVGAVFFSVSLGFLGLPKFIAVQIAGLELSAFQLIVALVLFYALLGTFLDGISSLLMTLPITLPLVLQAGYDKIWFGVFIIVTIEMAQITPPLGFNLFILKDMTKRTIGQIAMSALPFFLILCLACLLLAAIPSIATFLPSIITTDVK